MVDDSKAFSPIPRTYAAELEKSMAAVSIFSVAPFILDVGSSHLGCPKSGISGTSAISHLKMSAVTALY